MNEESQTEILLALHRIEDRLQQMVEILRISHKENIDSVQKKVLTGSTLRKNIYDLCDGTRSVGEIARMLGKSIQQISNNIATLQGAGLIREVRKGKEKCYTKVR
jgi:DNA-binding transcriptional ArsR family regulator